MFVIAGKITIDPENRDTAVTAATEMMKETHKESGCISYTFSADLEDPGCFRLFEEWELQAALDAHLKAPHMARFQAEIGKIGVRQMKVQRDEIASVGPLG